MVLWMGRSWSPSRDTGGSRRCFILLDEGKRLVGDKGCICNVGTEASQETIGAHRVVVQILGAVDVLGCIVCDEND